MVVMAIKFICSCGKHLKARDEMASRRSFCPKCGAPVGIPSLKPTVRGTLADPMSPHDRFRTKKVVPRAESPVTVPPVDPTAVEPLAESPGPILSPEKAGRTLDFSLVRMVLGRKHHPRKRAWPLEHHWYQCLLFPFRSWPLVFGLAIGLMLHLGLTAHLLPEVMKFSKAEPAFWVLCWSWGIITLVFSGYITGFLECTLASALAGEVGQIRWPGESFRIAMRSFGRWLSCFMAGPVVLASAACLFWLESGDFAVIDWLILGELVVIAFGYWMLAVVAAGRRDRLRDANPVQIGENLLKMGVAPVVVLAVVGVVTLLQMVWVYFALGKVHADPLIGWLNLAGCCLSVLFVNAFLMRHLGIACHLGHKPPIVEPQQEAKQQG
jgi:hypothetical protein